MAMIRNRRELLEAMLDASTEEAPEEAAQKLVRQEVAALMAARGDIAEDRAYRMVRRDIGYMTGFLERLEAARLLALFAVEHPVFGPIESWPNDPSEMLRMGYERGVAVREGRVEGMYDQT